jgi:release factor glutamine methyltransferase
MAVKLQTIKDIRNYLTRELSGLYTERETRSIANIIIPRIFGISTTLYRLKENETVADNRKIAKVISFCRELKAGRPLQYVMGETQFYDCIIKVSRGVLIPRPETEELVDLIVKENKGFAGTIIDIGTGSGCIAVALAVNFPSSQVTGLDVSGKAIRTAIENSKINNAIVKFLKADLFKIKPAEIKNADIIVSNPPYIRNSEKLLMKKNVLDFEPHRALFVPDNDPLKFYHAILDLAGHVLNPNGLVYFEINEAMGKPVRDLLESHKYREIKIIKDINGKDRIAKGKKYD